MRTCVGCRRRAVASELVRCALGDTGVLAVSAFGAGRGAWLCRRSTACVDQAVRGRRFDRAFRRSVAPAAVAAFREAFAAATTNVRESTRSEGATSDVAPPVKG